MAVSPFSTELNPIFSWKVHRRQRKHYMLMLWSKTCFKRPYSTIHCHSPASTYITSAKSTYNHCQDILELYINCSWTKIMLEHIWRDYNWNNSPNTNMTSVVLIRTQTKCVSEQTPDPPTALNEHDFYMNPFKRLSPEINT